MRIQILTHILLEGESSSEDVCHSLELSASLASRELNKLKSLGLLRKAPRRARYWQADYESQTVREIERFILLVENHAEIIGLFDRFSVLRLGAAFHREDRSLTMNELVKITALSYATVHKWISHLIFRGFLTRTKNRHPLLSMINGEKQHTFFFICHQLAILHGFPPKKDSIPNTIIERLKNDSSVLILLQYGSTISGTADESSDIDLLIVTRDPFTRGRILARSYPPEIDLNVFSKKGFIDLLKKRPDFVRNAASGMIHKGANILKEMLP